MMKSLTTGCLNVSSVAQYYHIPAREACQILCVSPSSLKNFCRRHGIKRWPSQKFALLAKRVSELNEACSKSSDADIRFRMTRMIEVLEISSMLLRCSPNATVSEVIDKARFVVTSNNAVNPGTVNMEESFEQMNMMESNTMQYKSMNPPPKEEMKVEKPPSPCQQYQDYGSDIVDASTSAFHLYQRIQPRVAEVALVDETEYSTAGTGGCSWWMMQGRGRGRRSLIL